MIFGSGLIQKIIKNKFGNPLLLVVSLQTFFPHYINLEGIKEHETAKNY